MSASEEKAKVLTWGESLLGPLKGAQIYNGSLIRTVFREAPEERVSMYQPNGDSAIPPYKLALKSFLECLVDEKNRNDDIQAFILFLQKPEFIAKLNDKERKIVEFVVSQLKQYLSVRERLINAQWAKFNHLIDLSGYNINDERFKEFSRLQNEHKPQNSTDPFPIESMKKQEIIDHVVRTKKYMSIDTEMGMNEEGYFLRSINDTFFEEYEANIIQAIQEMYSDEFIENQLLLAGMAPYINFLDFILASKATVNISGDFNDNVRSMIVGTSGAMLCSQPAAKIPDLVKSIAGNLDQQYSAKVNQVYVPLKKSADKINQGVGSNYIAHEGVVLQKPIKKSFREAILKKPFRDLLRKKILENKDNSVEKMNQQLSDVNLMHLIVKLTQTVGKAQEVGLCFRKSFSTELQIVHFLLQKKHLTDIEKHALQKIRKAKNSEELSVAIQPWIEAAIENLDPIVRAAILDDIALDSIGLSKSNRESLKKNGAKTVEEMKIAQEERDTPRIRALSAEQAEIKNSLALIEAIPNVELVEVIKDVSSLEMVQLWIDEKKKENLSDITEKKEEVAAEKAPSPSVSPVSAVVSATRVNSRRNPNDIAPSRPVSVFVPTTVGESRLDSPEKARSLSVSPVSAVVPATRVKSRRDDPNDIAPSRPASVSMPAQEVDLSRNSSEKELPRPVRSVSVFVPTTESRRGSSEGMSSSSSDDAVASSGPEVEFSPESPPNNSEDRNSVEFRDAAKPGHNSPSSSHASFFGKVPEATPEVTPEAQQKPGDIFTNSSDDAVASSGPEVELSPESPRNNSEDRNSVEFRDAAKPGHNSPSSNHASFFGKVPEVTPEVTPEAQQKPGDIFTNENVDDKREKLSTRLGEICKKRTRPTKDDIELMRELSAAGNARGLFTLAQAARNGDIYDKNGKRTKDTVAAYYLALLAYERTTVDKSRGSIKDFLKECSIPQSNNDYVFKVNIRIGDQDYSPKDLHIEVLRQKKVLRQEANDQQPVAAKGYSR